ncbi:MAG: uracil-DNA glycosylase [Candidatus Improbicoccus pseudotrichonymphae]|uniref:Type-4 uracil-DNA glycosylase n=1 Tax=Candidatus Improbicoccus pseudotrichonymphae TaxID=3033792 RepID=A0AA48IH31_9FIRM|nr:MAG: uracil-DNA glycosylase [Candidatus Improbicoccus pseudotrichonymphae]
MYEDWQVLKKDCEKCSKCELCKYRTQVVFGYGNPKSKIMFIGEGPGEQEDLQGKPFVGRSGKLLDKMLSEIGLDREKNIYIANIVKCRPPKNRDPFPGEQDACIGWLRNQFFLIRPKIMIALGRVSGKKIIDPNMKITRDHGIFYNKKDVWMMATLHPASLLRNPAQMNSAENDFKILKNKIKEVLTY